MYKVIAVNQGCTNQVKISPNEEKILECLRGDQKMSKKDLENLTEIPSTLMHDALTNLRKNNLVYRQKIFKEFIYSLKPFPRSKVTIVDAIGEEILNYIPRNSWMTASKIRDILEQNNVTFGRKPINLEAYIKIALRQMDSSLIKTTRSGGRGRKFKYKIVGEAITNSTDKRLRRVPSKQNQNMLEWAHSDSKEQAPNSPQEQRNDDKFPRLPSPPPGYNEFSLAQLLSATVSSTQTQNMLKWAHSDSKEQAPNSPQEHKKCDVIPRLPDPPEIEDEANEKAFRTLLKLAEFINKTVS